MRNSTYSLISFLLAPIVILFLALCTPQAQEVNKKQQSKLFTSVLQDGIPVELMVIEDPNITSLDSALIDKSLDRIFSQYTIEQLERDCERQITQIREYFRFQSLILIISEQHYDSTAFQAYTSCAVIATPDI